ncbi:MAG: 3-hydroxyacyl-CoA dehydrogenase family protein [Deferrisomatales bacterium]|nr:3-hydroxyacyl-CoA dehydrogenase family protein [Deferrisomatales bacterium]
MSSPRVGVIGAGLMGHGIAQVFAARGFEVRLQDVRTEALERARSRIRSQLELLGGGSSALSRIQTTLSLGEAVEGAEFVFEAVPEDLDLKREIFRRVGECADPHAIVASNTSTLSVSAMGEGTRNPENHVIAHWFNPPYLIPVVEVVPGERTSARTVDRTVSLLRDVGKEPVRVRREVPGFLVNRLQTALLREALALLQAGVAEPEELDKAVRGSFGLRLAVVGPLETADMGGLDLWLRGLRSLYPHLDNSREPQEILREKVGRGDLGTASGAGFFRYGDEARAAERSRDDRLLRLVRLLYSEDEQGR